MGRAGSALVGIAAIALGAAGTVGGVAAAVRAAPEEIGVADALDGRAGSGDWVTLSGHALPTWLETYDDADGDGTQDPAEAATEYAYVVMASGERRAIVVRTDREPHDVLRADVVGTVVADPQYVAGDLDLVRDDLGHVHLHPGGYVDAHEHRRPAGYLDGHEHQAGGSMALIPGARLPAHGTLVRIEDAPLHQYLVVCAGLA